MNRNEKRLDIKSIMYKFISIGFDVYLLENGKFIVNFLYCLNDDCQTKWTIWKRECLFCGSEFLHLYKCSKCNKNISIASSSKTHCNSKLFKPCFNETCISNTDNKISSILQKKGGVFGKEGYDLNQMRCSKCGEKRNMYFTAMVEIVNNFNDINVNGIIYLIRNGPNNFDIQYNNVIYKDKKLEYAIKFFNKK